MTERVGDSVDKGADQTIHSSDVIPCFLYLPTEEAHDWQDIYDPSMKFWSSIKGDLKEKVHHKNDYFVPVNSFFYPVFLYNPFSGAMSGEAILAVC